MNLFRKFSIAIAGLAVALLMTVPVHAQAPTIATALKAMGYATGQFGKNHLGDLNKFLSTLHGFDEFYGYLYHLDAMEDHCHPNFPQALQVTVGARNIVHSWTTPSRPCCPRPDQVT